MYFTTRSKSKALQSEFPIGDPFGGPAYGKREDISSALSIGSSLLGSSMQGDAAEDAANTSAAASNYSANLQKQMYDQTRADQTPWRNAGGNALGQLSYLMGLQNPNAQNEEQILGSQQQPQGADYGSLSKKFGMSDFNADHGYQFRMDQGINALQGRAAAGGGLKSGNTLKALMEYGQNLGSQEYGNAYNRFNNDQSTQFNRLSSMAGIGQTANSALQSAGTNYANSVGNLMTNNAANQGNSMLAGANARSSGYGAIGNALGNYFGGQQSNPGLSYTSGGNTYTGDFVYDNGNMVPMSSIFG